MDDVRTIVPPFAHNDKASARNACTAFINEYHGLLSDVEAYLKNLIETTEPKFAQAYKPWLNSLHDMCVGVYLLAKGIPLKRPQSLIDALKMFTFESSLKFLEDACSICKIPLKKDWLQKFRQDINTVLFAVAVLNRGQSQGRGI